MPTVTLLMVLVVVAVKVLVVVVMVLQWVYLLGGGLGDSEDLDEGLVFHQGALRAGQPVQQPVLQLLHPPLVGRHLLQELHPLRLQFLVEGRSKAGRGRQGGERSREWKWMKMRMKTIHASYLAKALH